MSVASVQIDVSPGELIDKITILAIKAKHIKDSTRAENVRRELDILVAARDREITHTDALATLTLELQKVNEDLWSIEDDIRDCEAAEDFDAKFIKLARSVYKNNDRRAYLKQEINKLLGSRIKEEKSYKPY